MQVRDWDVGLRPVAGSATSLWGDPFLTHPLSFCLALASFYLDGNLINSI